MNEKEILMNFNYNNLDYNQKVFQKKVENKTEEQEQEKGKVEEKKVAEEPKPRTMEISEGVLRKTDEMVVSYAKAAMQIPENVSNIKPEAVEVLPRDGETLEQLIEDWDANHTQNDFETNLGLINSILDLVRDNDELRFHWVCVKMQMLSEQRIEMFQNADTTDWSQEDFESFLAENVAIWNDNVNIHGDQDFFNGYCVPYNQLPDELKMDYSMTKLLSDTQDVVLYSFYSDNPALALGHNPNLTPNSINIHITNVQNTMNTWLGRITNIWQGPYEQMSNNGKIEFLTRMIDAYEIGLDDPEGASIWRTRRYNLCHQQHIQDQLTYLQDLENGAPYNPNAVPNPNVFDGDSQAASDLRALYDELSDVEKLVVDEERMAANTSSLLGILISLKNPDCTNADELKTLVNNRIYMIMNYYMDRALDNPENADKGQTVYQEQFIPKFDELKDIVNNPEQNGIYYLHAINSETGNLVVMNENITNLLNELTDIIDTLRDSGFPYCDELLVCIQGYLACAGFDSLNVLTPNGDGNTKPETVTVGQQAAKTVNAKADEVHEDEVNTPGEPLRDAANVNPAKSGNAKDGSVSIDIDALIQDTSLKDEPWYDTLANYFQPLFHKFQNHIDELNSSDMELIIRDLRDLVLKLRDANFPYCDELLVSIQEYIDYAGYVE